MLKPFATKLDEAVLKKLDELAQKTRIPKSRLCHQAIELLVDHYDQREKKLALAERIYQEDASLVASGSSASEKTF
ncbi:MAG TPA: ribbon-helix-helix domain-containing protein [Verrucomicrobiae bacterium]|jgi:predicted transcriptional regulator|nr:ribbon-helix-helix domain-containing protein [Verrucomicrobiae bacterium]